MRDPNKLQRDRLPARKGGASSSWSKPGDLERSHLESFEDFVRAYGDFERSLLDFVETPYHSVTPVYWKRGEESGPASPADIAGAYDRKAKRVDLVAGFRVPDPSPVLRRVEEDFRRMGVKLALRYINRTPQSARERRDELPDYPAR